MDVRHAANAENRLKTKSVQAAASRQTNVPAKKPKTFVPVAANQRTNASAKPYFSPQGTLS